MIAMLRSVLLSALALSGAMAYTNLPKLDEKQAALLDGWSNFSNDYNALKNLYTDNARIRNCYAPMPCEEFVGFDAAYAGYVPVVADFHMSAAPISVTNNIFTWIWTDFVVTSDGCTAVFSGIALTEYDDNGLIKDFSCMSDNMQPLYDCLAPPMEEA